MHKHNCKICLGIVSKGLSSAHTLITQFDDRSSELDQTRLIVYFCNQSVGNYFNESTISKETSTILEVITSKHNYSNFCFTALSFSTLLK